MRVVRSLFTISKAGYLLMGRSSDTSCVLSVFLSISCFGEAFVSYFYRSIYFIESSSNEFMGPRVT